MQKKKILYVITRGNWGGAQRYVFDLATSLPKNEYDVTVAFGDATVLKEKLEAKKIKIIVLKHLQREVSMFRNLRSLYEMRKIIKMMKPDIVHSNSSMAGFVATVAARLSKVPQVVFTAHNWSFNDNQRSAFSKLIFTTIHHMTIRMAHTTIAVSEKTKAQIKIEALREKIKVVHNGIDSFRSYSVQKSKEALLVKHADKTWVGTIAELHTNKGLDVLIDSFAKIYKDFPDVILCIVGSGEEEKELTKHIARHHLEERAFLVGYVNNAKQYIKAFDVFTLISRTEALPYVLLEAGLAERAVVASTVGGIPEIVSNLHSGILVRPENVKETESALRYILTNDKERREFGKQLKDMVEYSFSLDKMVSKTTRLYH